MGKTENLFLRVPEVTLMFWIIKTLSTTVGETAADFLSIDLGFGMSLVALIMSIIMAYLLFVQFAKLKRYVPVNYWSIVVLMSIVGTLITDILVDKMGVTDFTLSIVFSITMISGFIIWHKQEKTLSIHSIYTAKREMYYWIIILSAFALGTAVGDLISEQILSAGYGIALLLFSSLIAFVAFGYYVFKMNSVLAFWLAFILTRPLGASLGDFMTQSPVNGGLGLGMAAVNALFFTAIVISVAYLSIKQRNLSVSNIAEGQYSYVKYKK